MAVSTTYAYRENRFFDFKILSDILRFLMINVILAFIFLFLSLEELDWFLLSSRQKQNDVIIDKSSWNIKKIF
tara:strand:- start:2176 stop:2394 length:219 start_codon:yes stop_codon:yes gene_type:complete